MMKVLGAILAALAVTAMLAAPVDARGRKGSHRVGGY
jgi:hypothetical protein